jgi:superfamily II DNA or RNA helicase
VIELVIGNSYSKITGLTLEQHRKLAKELSYMVGSHFSSGFGPKRVSLLSKKGEFPTGLLYLVKSHFKNPNEIKVHDTRTRPDFAFKPSIVASLGVTPYPEQIDASRACLAHNRGVVVAPTGLGKSMICALIIDGLKVPTLIVVPNLELKRQLSESLASIFGDVVGTNKTICVENIDSNNLKKLKTQYHCVIIDEFHHSAAKTYRDLNKKHWTGIYYRFGLTATPFRSQDNERILLESILSKVIYRIDYHTAVAKGYICPMESFYVEIPRTRTNSIRWSGVYSDLVVNNVQRNSVVASLLSALKSAEKSTLCLVKEIAHGKQLSEMTGVMFANGQDEDSADMIKFFSEGKITALIGTTGVLGEGVDTKPAEYVIIAGLGKSKPQFMQSCGRGFRRYPGKESCKVIIFLDNSHKWTKAHYREQVKILAEEYNSVPEKLEIST